MDAAYAFRITEIHPYQESLADDVFVRHETPVTAVRAIVAVIAHHEVITCWYYARKTVFVIVAGFLVGEILDFAQVQGWRRIIVEDAVAHARQVFFQLLVVNRAFVVEVVVERRVFHWLAIDRQALVFISDLITRHADYALDVILGHVFRILEDHDIAALRIVHFNDALIDDRQTDTVGELVHQDQIAYQQGRHHRRRWNLEGLVQERAQAKDQRDDRKKAARILDPGRLAQQRSFDGSTAAAGISLDAFSRQLGLARIEISQGTVG